VTLTHSERTNLDQVAILNALLSKEYRFMSYRMGKRGKERRESLGLTQSELAAKLGTSQGVIGRWELDGAPKFESIRSWATALHMTFDELAFDPEELAESQSERAAEIDYETLRAAGER
jgi:transcriptional regulator with XRE-family HTH domain